MDDLIAIGLHPHQAGMARQQVMKPPNRLARGKHDGPGEMAVRRGEVEYPAQWYSGAVAGLAQDGVAVADDFSGLLACGVFAIGLAEFDILPGASSLHLLGISGVGGMTLAMMMRS